jgi:small subunit ribosomal protein S1
MQDKNHDPYFDEENENATAEKQLLGMIDQYAKPGQVELKVGARVTGTVNRVGDDTVNVDIDGKNSAVLRTSEVAEEDGSLNVKVGDTIEAFVSSMQGDSIILSKSLSGSASSKEELHSAMEQGLPVQGKVTGINKGGLQVKVMGASGFCPASQVDIKYVDDLNEYLDRSMTFVITRMDGKRVVLSRVPILEQEVAARLDELEEDNKTRRVRSGPITRIAEFGLFIDTGTGIDGLAHISEVSWARADNLAENFTVGQEVEYVVLSIERKEPLRTTKISLSLKQAVEDPWTTAATTFPVGSQVNGTITRLAPFGAFVQLTPGVEGLIHLSELSWDHRVRRAEDVVKPGMEVRVTILSVDENTRKIGCTLKDVDSDPWRDVPQRFAVGSTVTGTVVSRQKYGYFVDLSDGITGLLAIPNIAPDKRNALKVDEQLEVTITGIDMERRRISLAYGVEADTSAQEREAVEHFEKQAESRASGKGTSEFGEALRAALKKKTK